MNVDAQPAAYVYGPTPYINRGYLASHLTPTWCVWPCPTPLWSIWLHILHPHDLSGFTPYTHRVYLVSHHTPTWSIWPLTLHPQGVSALPPYTLTVYSNIPVNHIIYPSISRFLCIVWPSGQCLQDTLQEGVLLRRRTPWIIMIL